MHGDITQSVLAMEVKSTKSFSKGSHCASLVANYECKMLFSGLRVQAAASLFEGQILFCMNYKNARLSPRLMTKTEACVTSLPLAFSIGLQNTLALRIFFEGFFFFKAMRQVQEGEDSSEGTNMRPFSVGKVIYVSSGKNEGLQYWQALSGTWGCQV